MSNGNVKKQRKPRRQNNPSVPINSALMPSIAIRKCSMTMRSSEMYFLPDSALLPGDEIQWL
jgi:hypothetical protein